MERKLLLVDDEENILRSLVRLFRRDGYKIYTANSGKQGLEILAENDVGVILSDQRMPEMNGTEFLSRAKLTHPGSVRIVLSGYTDLSSITDAINDGDIYKFLTKPWEDDSLRENVQEAFRQYELVSENKRLNDEVRIANDKLRKANEKLEKNVELQTHYADINLRGLQIAQEVLDNLPLAVLGIGNDDIISMANIKAHEYLCNGGSRLIGMQVKEALPCNIYEGCPAGDALPKYWRVNMDDGHVFDVMMGAMGKDSDACGIILALVQCRST